MWFNTVTAVKAEFRKVVYRITMEYEVTLRQGYGHHTV